MTDLPEESTPPTLNGSVGKGGAQGKGPQRYAMGLVGNGCELVSARLIPGVYKCRNNLGHIASVLWGSRASTDSIGEHVQRLGYVARDILPRLATMLADDVASERQDPQRG